MIINSPSVACFVFYVVTVYSETFVVHLRISCLCFWSPVITQYSRLSLRRTPVGPAPTIRLRGVGLIESLDTVTWLKNGAQGPTPGVRLMEVSILQRCPLRESWLYYNMHLNVFSRKIPFDISLIIFETKNSLYNKHLLQIEPFTVRLLKPRPPKQILCKLTNSIWVLKQ